MFELKTIVRKNILELKPYSSARDEFKGSEGIFLDANENPFGEFNRYPDPYQSALKEVLASQKRVCTNRIFVGNGSDEVIDLLFRIFCEPGKDRALTFSPTYGMYDVSAAINAVELVKLPLTESFEIDLERTIAVLRDPAIKLTFICSPNNPTGNAFPIEVIEQILQSSNGIIVIDEAYIEFSTKASLIRRINDFPNLIVTQTMSKAYGLAAARIGFAFASEAIIELLNKVKPPYNISQLNQQVAITALQQRELFASNVEIILSEKQKLISSLSELNLVENIYPSDANFLLVQFTNGAKVFESLVNQKIIVRNRNNMVKNCIRITIGTPEENQQLIEALKIIENEKSIVY